MKAVEMVSNRRAAEVLGRADDVELAARVECAREGLGYRGEVARIEEAGRAAGM